MMIYNVNKKKTQIIEFEQVKQLYLQFNGFSEFVFCEITF